jgi:hypothetical protein
MSPEKILPTVAEIAVTLATLSGVAGVLARRAPGTPQGFDASRVLLRDVAVSGMFAALFALLPLLLEGSWRALSGVAAFVWLGAFAMSARQLRRYEFPDRVQAWAGPLITLLGMILFGWNVVAPDAASPVRYTAGVLCQLGIAGFAFIHVVFTSSSE